MAPDLVGLDVGESVGEPVGATVGDALAHVLHWPGSKPAASLPSQGRHVQKSHGSVGKLVGNLVGKGVGKVVVGLVGDRVGACDI